MKLTCSGLKLSFLLLGLAAIVVVLLVSTLDKFDAKGRSLLLIFNLVTVIFLSSRNPSSSDEHEGVVQTALSEGTPATDGDDDNDIQELEDDVKVVDEDSDNVSIDYDSACYSSDIEDNDNAEHDCDDDEYGIDSEKVLEKRADEFIAKMIEGWMEEKLRDAMLMRPS